MENNNLPICDRCGQNQSPYFTNDGASICYSCWYNLSLEFKDSRISQLEETVAALQIVNDIYADALYTATLSKSQLSVGKGNLTNKDYLDILDTLEDIENKKYFTKTFSKSKKKGGVGNVRRTKSERGGRNKRSSPRGRNKKRNVRGSSR